METKPFVQTPIRDMIRLVYKHNRHQESAIDDAITSYYGVQGMVSDSLNEAGRKMFRNNGWSIEEYNDAAVEVVSYRWLYYNDALAR